MDHVTRLIALEEGCKLAAYTDSRGIWTIGYGYNLESHGYSPEECAGITWTQEQAEQSLVDEIEVVEHELDRRWPKWRDLDEVRRAAIVSSVYQLGAPGAAHFCATIAALQAHDWATAAQQMLASRWAKQTPARVQRNAAMIQTGQWPEDVNGTKFLSAPEPAAPAPMGTTPADVAPAPAQPDARVLSADREPSFTFDDVAEALQDVRTGHIQSSPGLAKILKALSTSKTIWGTVTLFLMVLWQYLGIQSWSDIGISIRGHIYPITDLFPYIAPAFATLATWGKVKQTVKGGVHA